MRALLVALAALSAGCVLLPGEEGDGPAPTAATPTPPPGGPPLVFGGSVRDARSGELIPLAHVRVDLAQALPCGRQGVGWRSWDPPLLDGAWGPLEVPRPRSDDVAFFVHATAPGFAENATFIGPAQARAPLSNLTLLLHPDEAVEGTAPPGTLLALDAPIFPRVALADATGAFRFPAARSAEAHLVAGLDTPFVSIVRAPAHVDVPTAAGRGWALEGSLRGPSGGPVAADVVAWNGSRLVSVARSADTGAFSLPLAPEPVALRVEARTAENHLGGVLLVELSGPPALRETVLMKPLC